VTPMAETYEIVRFYANGRSEIIESDLTLEEAKAHCRDPETQETGKWFDGYRKQ